MKKYQVVMWAPSGSYRMMTTAKSARQAVAFCKYRLRSQGVFDVIDSETEVTEV